MVDCGKPMFHGKTRTKLLGNALAVHFVFEVTPVVNRKCVSVQRQQFRIMFLRQELVTRVMLGARSSCAEIRQSPRTDR